MIKKIVHTEYRDDKKGFVYTLEPIEDTIEVKETKDGYTVKYLTQDNDPIPLDYWDNGTCTLVHYHRDCWIENNLCPKDVLGYIFTKNEDEYDKDGAEALLKTHYVFPVSAYIHSGVCLSLAKDNFHPFDGQGWDTSHVGAVCVKKTEFGSGGVQFEHTEDEARTMAEGLVKTWNQYLSGEVYCIVKEEFDKDKVSGDYDIVGGFYGYKYAKECLKTEWE